MIWAVLFSLPCKVLNRPDSGHALDKGIFGADLSVSGAAGFQIGVDDNLHTTLTPVHLQENREVTHLYAKCYPLSATLGQEICDQLAELNVDIAIVRTVTDGRHLLIKSIEKCFDAPVHESFLKYSGVLNHG